MEIPLEKEALEEVCFGMMLAELAITDGKKDTVRKIAKINPWHLEAMKLITGTEEQAHKPLRTILKEDMEGLVLDCELDISGMTKSGHFLDTQGYIAHNDETIVVAFRCTTSAFDWMTNFNTTSSVWEIEKDLAAGNSGFCSGFEGLCCAGGTYKPRVHTGFYNNLLAALPTIKQHVDPLLSNEERPRKLFVVGHSLGAGIATLAGCYFINEYNWNELPQRLVIVTAGSPRACCESMKEIVDQKRNDFGDKCRVYRVVKGNDVVTCVPPKLFGFCHLIDPIKITDAGQIVVRTNQEDPDADLLELTKYRVSCDQTGHRDQIVDDDSVGNEPTSDTKSKYDRLVARIPKSLRDHMPDFYLRPMLTGLGIRWGSTRAELAPGRSLSVAIDDEDTKAKPHVKEVDKHEGAIKKTRSWIPKAFRSKKTVPVPEQLYF